MKVISKKYLGKRKTYDIVGVTPNNNFVANGVISHNCNFLEVQEESARTRGKERYDAAEEMYNHMTGRMKSRFINPYTGNLDGTLFMFSSVRYPDDFLEKKAKERFALQENSKIYISRRTVWDAKPKWYFNNVKFKFDIAKKEVLHTEQEIEELRALAEKDIKETPKLLTTEEKHAINKERRERIGWNPDK